MTRQEFARALERKQTQPPFMPEPNPLQRAFDDYQRMEGELAEAHIKQQELLTQNMSLLAEVNMLREAYERADTDRVRLQQIASTLLGRLLAINDTIAGAVKASIQNGIEAATAERPIAEAAEPVQRVTAADASPPAPAAITSPRAPNAAVGAAIPAVDWSRLPQGQRQ